MFEALKAESKVWGFLERWGAPSHKLEGLGSAVSFQAESTAEFWPPFLAMYVVIQTVSTVQKTECSFRTGFRILFSGSHCCSSASLEG